MTATIQRMSKAAWLFWLLAALSLCATVTAITLAVVHVVLPAQRQQLAAETWVEHTQQVIMAIDGILVGGGAIAMAVVATRAKRRSVTDVTALRRVEAELHATEARLSFFIDNAPASIAMFDTALCYLAVSSRFLRDLRLDDQTPASMIGRCHYDIFPDVPDHRRSIHRRVLAGESLSSEAEPLPRADGRVDWVRWEMSPWRTADGTIGGALLFLENMTERIAAQMALQHSEARLRLVQKVSGIAHYDRALSDDAAIISDEFTRMFGLPPEQTRITSAESLALVHPDDRDRVAAAVPHTLARGDKFLAEFRIRLPGGEQRWISTRTAIFPGPDGQPSRVIAALQDITEIVAAREVLVARHDELERSNAELEQFAYTISHDLKAPLRAIDNLAQWIGEDMKEIATPEAIDNLGLMQGRVARMQNLLAGLMDYSRAGQIDKTIDEIAIADVVSNIVAMQAPPPGFVVTYEGAGLMLRTHSVALQVVLENLISNSLKHHDRAEGRITIRTRLVDGLMEFRVSDDGPGIPEQFHRRIFEIFQTLQSRDDRESTGIGLAIVKRKVESHGGRIWVESAPPARGTSFVFTWRETVA